MAGQNSSKKVVVKNVRLSYAQVFKPKAFKDQTAKYSAVLLLDKEANAEDIKKVQSAILEVAKDKFGDRIKGDRLPSKFHNPLKDSDEDEDLIEQNPAYEGCYNLRCSSITAPSVYGKHKEVLREEDGIVYSGCYCDVSLNISTFDADINKGVTAYLNALKFVADGERFGGGGDYSGDFDFEDDEDFDDLL